MVSTATTRREWPLLGRDIDEASFEDLVWEESDLLFVVFPADSDVPVGILQGYGADLRSKTIALGFSLDSHQRLRGWPFEGVIMFIELLFSVYGFRKLYLWLPDAMVEAFEGTLRTRCTKEAQLDNQVPAADGTLESLQIWSLSSSTWDSEYVRRMLHIARVPATRSVR